MLNSKMIFTPNRDFKESTENESFNDKFFNSFDMSRN